MKKLLALLLSAAMLLSLAACGGGGDETQPQSGETGYQVAMITDYGDITDQSFNQTTYEACKAYCERGGIPFTYYKPVGDSDADRIAMVDAAVMDGYNIIVLPGFAFPETIKQTADIYPEVKFIALDVGQNELGDYELPDNVYCAIYQEELSGYMAGVAAVKLGYRHLGVLGGMAAPAVQRFAYGFLQGVDDAAAELNVVDQVKVEYVYGNQFFGDADITAVMDTWYSSLGVELVFSCGGGIWSSAAEAAAKVGGKLVGVDVDQAAIIDPVYGEGMTITSAMKGLGPTVENTIADVVENDNWAAYGGKIANLGLISAEPTENYVQLPLESTQWNDGFTQADYKALVAAMFDGTITVSSDISAMPETQVAVTVHPNIKG
ncbi:MAG: BMP family ABC transporter substrate-binding protein [Ruminococcaceae bacterium]|nr:BMP family ABC transporter substrate-binding protein [Oscillospiraceae bacterium]